jgi:nucleotide-binding universal stress UspA family protein
MLNHQQSPPRDFYLRAEQQLEHWVEQARQQGIEADTRLVFGRNWQQAIAEVTQGCHDLVLLGTRQRNVVSRALFGSFALKLLRHCPCPVWVAREESNTPRTVFVAHDLRSVGNRALQVGQWLAEAAGAELHVMHILEHPEFQAFLASLPGEVIEQRRSQARQQIEAQLRMPAQIIIGDGRPYDEILGYLREHPTDVVVMGTLARTGLSGALIGNTAENLIPWIPCSLLAIKPEAEAK